MWQCNVATNKDIDDNPVAIIDEFEGTNVEVGFELVEVKASESSNHLGLGAFSHWVDED